jgi:endogenous inhibitor of DNA gyrase (YacG/DUF329 family)
MSQVLIPPPPYEVCPECGEMIEWHETPFDGPKYWRCTNFDMCDWKAGEGEQ